MKLKEIAKILNIDYKGEDININALNSLSNAKEYELTYCDGEKNSKDIEKTKASVILVSDKFKNLVPKNTKILISKNPHLDFAILSKFFSNSLFDENIINQNISKKSKIMPNVYIGNNVTIKDNVVVMAGSYIGDNVFIDEDTMIHPNVVIYNNTKIGKRCHLLANCVVGSDGFGYAHNEKGEHIKIYHNGNVILEDDVEIGACTTIDRAVFNSTIIKKGTKIDNLVQIGHNCNIGENCLLVAQSGISGSSILGKNVIMGGQSATSGHLKIGDFAIIAARGGVSKTLDGGKTYGGFPIMLQKDWLKVQAKIALSFKDKNN